MQRCITFVALLFALTSPASAKPFQWQVKKDQRFAVQWRSSDWRKTPGQVEKKSTVDMDWQADEAIIETGSLRVTLKRFQFSYEDPKIKISLEWTAGAAMKSVIRKKSQCSADDERRASHLQSTLESLTTTPLIVTLQSNGRHKILAAQFKEEPDKAPKIPLFEAMLDLPNEGPLDLEASSGGRLEIEKLPQFYASNEAARAPLPYALSLSEHGSLLLSLDQSRGSARSYETFGFACFERCRGFRAMIHERCQSELRLRHEFSAHFLKSSEVRLNTNRFETSERISGPVDATSRKASEWVRISTSLKVQAR